MPTGRSASLLLLLLLLGCRDPTQVTVTIRTDVACEDMVDTSVLVSAGDETTARVPQTSTSFCQDDGYIGSIVVVPRAEGQGSKFDLEVVSGIGRASDACQDDTYENCIVARRSMAFVPHTKLQIPIGMNEDCLGIACNPLTTCVERECRPATIVDPRHCVGPSGCTEDSLEPACIDTDLSSDADNCGVCGRSCLGGACNDGDCGPPVAVQTEIARPLGVIVHEGFMYWTELYLGGSILRAPMDGGAPEAIVEDLDKPAYVQVIDGRLWFTQFGGTTIDSVNLTGGARQTEIEDAGSRVLGLAYDAIYIYWTIHNSNTGRLMRQVRTGGSPEALVQDLAYPEGVIVHNGRLYVVEEGLHRILEVAATGDVSIVLQQLDDPVNVAVDGDWFYFTEQQSNMLRRARAHAPREDFQRLASEQTYATGLTITSDAII